MCTQSQTHNKRTNQYLERQIKLTCSQIGTVKRVGVGLYLHDVMGCRLPEGCPILQQIYAWHCIALSSHDNTVQKHNNKEGSKTMRNFTKPCVNLSEYRTLSMGYSAKSWKSNQTK